MVKLRSAYKLWLEFWEHFPRLQRYTLGEKINNLFLETLELAFTAAYLPKELKSAQLTKVATKLDLLKLFCQIAWENRMINNQNYTTISEQLNEVGRMIGGWQKQLSKK